MIKVAIVGVGNCASSLVQGVAFYSANSKAAGLIFRSIADRTLDQIEFVAAFDIDSDKVGKPLKEAIFQGRNNAQIFYDENFSCAECEVSSAPLLDSVGSGYIEELDGTSVSGDSDVDMVLERTKPDILINYLPVGADQATQYWASKCLKYGVSFLNAVPSFICSDPNWARKFEEAGIPCAGDDIKSQIGATLIHRALCHAFDQRGGTIEDTYQLNFGGNMDFLNMMEGNRLSSKKTSKTRSIQDEIKSSESTAIHISPSDHISYLGDKKIAYINLKGFAFGGAEIEIETKISVQDSPNSAGCVVDIIRFLDLARSEGDIGVIDICGYYFKSPLISMNDDDGWNLARLKATPS